MEFLHGIGVLSGNQYLGGLTRWRNPQAYTAFDFDQGIGGFAQQAIWVFMEQTGEIIDWRWVEIGFTQGWQTQDITTLFWAENTGGSFFEHRLPAAAVEPGIDHRYRLRLNKQASPQQWRVILDGELVGISNQGGEAIQIYVGGEITDRRSIITPTIQKGIAYIDSNGNRKRWNDRDGNEISLFQEDDSPVKFEWLGRGYKRIFSCANYPEPAAPEEEIEEEIEEETIVEPEVPTPANLAPASGGPHIEAARLEQIAREVAAAYGEENPTVAGQVLTTHGRIQSLALWGASYSVAGDRETCLVLLEGNFTPRRRPPGAPPPQVKQLQIEIDATSGDVLSAGCSNKARSLYGNSEQLAALKTP